MLFFVFSTPFCKCFARITVVTIYQLIDWTLVEKMRPCLERLKHVYGQQGNFSKMCLIAYKKIRKIAISYWIQKWFAASGPDFYAISKMVHYISVP